MSVEHRNPPWEPLQVIVIRKRAKRANYCAQNADCRTKNVFPAAKNKSKWKERRIRRGRVLENAR